MLAKLGKVLGMSAPLISVAAAYQMWFGMKYVGATSETSTTQTVTALEFALKQGSNAILFWPVAVFFLSCIGAFAVWKNLVSLVWIIACSLLIVSIMGMMTIGLIIAPIAILLLTSAIILTLEKGKAIG